MASEKLNRKHEEEQCSTDFALNKKNATPKRKQYSHVLQYREYDLCQGETFIRQSRVISTITHAFLCPHDRRNSAEVTDFCDDFCHNEAIQTYCKGQDFLGSEESRVEEETFSRQMTTRKAKPGPNYQQTLTTSRGIQKTGHLLCATKVLSYLPFVPIISLTDNLLKSPVNHEDCKTEYGKIKEETQKFSKDAIRYVLTTKLCKNDKLIQEYSPLNDPLARSVRKLVTQMITMYRTSYEISVQKLDISANNIFEAFKAVTDNLFEGNNDLITWSRLIALLSFGAQMTLHLYENGMEEFASDTVNFVGTHLGERVTPWIQKQGGWINLYKSFPQDNHVDSTAMKTFSTTVGILATAAAILYTFLS
ncbi:uncharacterized protein LOC111085677 [Limulus polyphemus]|uniref:Uncharacterized protein LOC111085677 n=1 Tax=Limulus polyphemus TaxID=6850 RepID=A0ABM1SBT6_LIMPO|nr:uncharacterized protein LOC111085677 [Limulus polyphemus]XP_022241092.1 uncharacterized protein LOC111085677 [Limulus polyphemus]